MIQGAGPLSDVVLVKELIALRVLRSKRSALEGHEHDVDMRLFEAQASCRELEM
jgi:hypothetical protein